MNENNSMIKIVMTDLKKKKYAVKKHPKYKRKNWNKVKQYNKTILTRRKA